MTSASKSVWITRAQPGADVTAKRVRALGHHPVVEPLLKVELVAGPPLDLTGVGALAFTSANGVRAFCRQSSLRRLPVFAVGDATAAAAKAAGFLRVRSADGDVAALAADLIAHRDTFAGSVLHPGAVAPSGDLSGWLAAAGMEARPLPLYDTRVLAPTAQILRRLRRIDVVLVHSPKCGLAVAAALRDAPSAHLHAVGISQAALAPLAQTPLAARSCPPQPREAEMLRLIDSTV